MISQSMPLSIYKWRVMNIALAGIVFMDYFRYLIDIIWAADVEYQIGNNVLDFITALMCVIFSLVNLVYFFKHIPPVTIYGFMLIFGLATCVINVVNQSIDISTADKVYVGRKFGYEVFKNVLEMLLVVGEVFTFLKVCKRERLHIISKHEVVYHHTRSYY